MRAEVERWREVCAALDVDLEYLPSVREAGDALAAALEARDREHDAAIGRMVGEIEARDRRIERLQERLEDAENANEAWSVGAERTRKHIAELQSLVKGYAFTLEARDRRIADLEAGVRRIADYAGPPAPGVQSPAVLEIKGIARDLLAGRAPEPEGGFRERCDSCGQDHHVVWSADNAMWNAVVGSPNGKRCPTCFDREAEAAGYVVLFRASAVRRAADDPGPDSPEPWARWRERRGGGGEP